MDRRDWQEAIVANRSTSFGQSSGSATVVYLIASPLAKRLSHQITIYHAINVQQSAALNEASHCSVVDENIQRPQYQDKKALPIYP